jgi:hypothetical protein
LGDIFDVGLERIISRVEGKGYYMELKGRVLYGIKRNKKNCEIRKKMGKQDVFKELLHSGP